MMSIFEPKIQIDTQKQIFSNSDLKKLIFPLLIEQILMLLVGIIDTLMVSYAGEAAVSGVSLVNQFYFHCSVYGVGIGRRRSP